MEQLIEFVTNNYLLVLAFILALGMLLFSESKKAGASVTTTEAVQLINKQDAVLLDIRTKKEWENGFITNSIHIPLVDLDKRIGELEKHKSKDVIVVCNMGQTAGSASKKLMAAGFEKVVRLKGGIVEWKAQSLPLIK
ncbi:MAG: rhodanese-like domain-containing protein [Oceanospirillaceae bacterium]|nr:rhodanese-like domain-containing protein [Oceanospirillaceae bacterium]